MTPNTATAANDSAPLVAPHFTALNAAGEIVAFGAPDHIITSDARSGLEYTPVGERHASHQAAMDACAALDIAGGGWRAPTRAELFAITDVTREDPAVDTTAFPFVQARWYWSSDLTAWSASAAWVVLFNGGDVSYNHRDNGNGFALAVRRAGQ